jgi:hypothetical protein
MRRALAVLCASAIFVATPALAGHTQDAVVYDPATGYVQQIVIPTDDSELNDPAFNPPGMVQVRVPHQTTPGPAVAAVPSIVSQAQAAKPQAAITLPPPVAASVVTAGPSL